MLKWRSLRLASCGHVDKLLRRVSIAAVKKREYLEGGLSVVFVDDAERAHLGARCADFRRYVDELLVLVDEPMVTGTPR